MMSQTTARTSDVSSKDERELFRRAVLIRQFEEKLLDLFSQGKLSGTVHTCIGEEFSALAVIDQLREGDWIFSNHRCHGHYLAWSEDVRGLMAEIMGKSSGICAGRGGSQHICNGQFLSNGVQGGGVPIAAGCALALSRANVRNIATAFIGDGTLGQGIVYETLNLVSKWNLPLLMAIEHNGYAQSTNTNETIAGGVRERFEAFGVRFFEGSIWEREELFATARAAAEYVRTERKPAALCIKCYRLKAHSKGDDNRTPEEISSFQNRDPLQVFSKQSPDVSREINARCAAELRAVAEELEKEVPAMPDAEAGSAFNLGSSKWTPLPAAPTPVQKVLERLRAGLKGLMARDEKVFLMGEDVEDPYGGAFKVTKGLSSEFPGRVRNTPISEAAIVGVGNGIALGGMRPVVEVMFGDFITLAADQLINQSSKFAYMYNGQVSVPVIVRTPMGGKRGYGATHSQSLEKHFFGTPGLHIAAVNAVFDPAALLERIHDKLNSPCLLIEHKLLYTANVHSRAPDGRAWLANDADFPTLKLEAPGKGDATVVAYGGMLPDVEEAVQRAFMEDELMAEVLAPTMIYPLDITPIAESVARTGRLLVVEEGQGFAGFGAEVIARCLEKLGGGIEAARVNASAHPIPCSRELEKHALPDATSVLKAIRELAKQ